MSATKLKLFKIRISDDSRFTLSKATQNTINKFLSDPNVVYVSHSTSVLSEDEEHYGDIYHFNRFLVISIVYKDLISSAYNLETTSEKVREVVRKEIEHGDNITEPELESEFDKEFKELNKRLNK